MARLIEPRGGEGPANESERRVVEQLRRELPESYVLVPNLEVAEPRGGQLSEYDLVVVAPHAVYAVEVKDLAGRSVATSASGSSTAARVGHRSRSPSGRPASSSRGSSIEPRAQAGPGRGGCRARSAAGIPRAR